MRKLYPFLTICVLLTLPAATGAAQVTFRVDMRYQSLAPGDIVVVRGSASSLGEWEGSELALSPIPDPAVYSGTFLVPELASGEVFYKYVIIRAGGEEVWEERGNRVLTPPTDALTLTPVFFSDIEEGGIGTPVSVRFLVDLEDLRFDDEPPAGIGIVGGRPPLSWEPAAAISMYPTGIEGQWQADIAFPEGTLLDVPFKLVYNVGGYPEWSGPLAISTTSSFCRGRHRKWSCISRGTQRSSGSYRTR